MLQQDNKKQDELWNSVVSGEKRWLEREVGADGMNKTLTIC